MRLDRKDCERRALDRHRKWLQDCDVFTSKAGTFLMDLNSRSGMGSDTVWSMSPFTGAHPPA